MLSSGAIAQRARQGCAMPSANALTARLEVANALIGKTLKVHAGAFNGRWNNARLRELDNKPEFFTGEILEFFQGATAARDRWKVRYVEDGKETGDVGEDPWPHAPIGFLRLWLVGDFPESVAAAARTVARAARQGRAEAGLGGDRDAQGELQEIAQEEADSDSDNDEGSGWGSDESNDDDNEEEHEVTIQDKQFSFTYSETHAEVLHDQRSKDGFAPGNPQPSFNLGTSVLDVLLLTTTFLKYLLVWFPPGIMTLTLNIIEREGRNKWGSRFLRQGRKFTQGLFVSWLTCWVYMLLHPGLARASYWDVPSNGRVAHNLGARCHLSKDEFERILQVFALPRYSPDSAYTAPDNHGPCGPPPGTPYPIDPFDSVRRFIDACNAHWAKVITPGWLLVIDESMIKWLSRYRLPGWMMVGRKPDSVGHELKTLCCALSRILFRVELQEGKTFDRLKKYVATVGATAALTIRMLEPFAGIAGHTVICDSWFGSVTTCLLLASMGIYSLCNVKTSHKHFPKDKLLEALMNVEVGEHVCYPFEVNLEGKTVTFYAVGHKGPGEDPLQRHISTLCRDIPILFFLGFWVC